MSDDQDRQWREWAALAQQGDRKAYGLLLRAVVPFIRAVVAPRVANPDWTDDIVQDVLMSLHRALHTYSPDRPFRPWLSAIIAFRRTDFLRRHYSGRRHQSVSLDDPEFIAGHVTGTAFAGEFKDVEKALGSFSDKQRRVFIRMRIEGHSAEEVAREMDMTVSAVKVSVHRTANRLKELLGQ